MDYQLILPEYSWRKIRSRCTELIKLAEIFTGCTVGKMPERKRWKDYPNPKEVYWLTGAKDVIKNSFLIFYDSATTITYPNDLKEPLKSQKGEKGKRKDKEHLLAGKKILLTSDPDPSWGKRTKVVIERRGYYVSDSFLVIVPTPPLEMSYITHEVVAAVLDWKVSNAWILEPLKHLKIPIRAVRTVPFPNLSENNCKILTDAVHKIEKAVEAGSERPIEATQAIDAVLKAAYQLDDETFERLRLVAEWDIAPQITLDEQPAPNARWKTGGIVDSVDAENGTITLWLRNFDELQTVPISPVMPGWLLRPEVAFRTSIPRACVRQRNLANVSWGKFYPQDYTYLNEKELFDELTELLNSPPTKSHGASIHG